jgi:hypothetical protein
VLGAFKESRSALLALIVGKLGQAFASSSSAFGATLKPRLSAARSMRIVPGVAPSLVRRSTYETEAEQPRPLADSARALLVIDQPVLADVVKLALTATLPLSTR